jgi:N-formylglutamate amidohydrolase
MKYDKIILNIPHSSTIIPNKEGFIVENLADNNIELIDLYTDDLFAIWDNQDIIPVVFEFSRFYCDVEHFWDNSKEINFVRGQGVIYTHDNNGYRYREITPQLSIRCAEEYIRHWNRLTNAKKMGINPLLIDCHSFKPSDTYNPDVCIGYNNDFMPVCMYVKDFFVNNGFSVEFNKPYSGTIEIPGIDSLMIELNKDIYLQEDCITKRSDFYKIHALIHNLYNNILFNEIR